MTVTHLPAQQLQPVPQPVAQPAPQPVAQPVPQPVAQPVPQPAAAPAEPVALAVPEDLDLELVAQLRGAVANELSAIRREEALSEDLSESDEEARAGAIIWKHLDDLARYRAYESLPPLGAELEERLARRIHADLFGLGGFEDYVYDPLVENIFVNGCDKVFVNRADAKHIVQVGPIAESDEALVALINRWASQLGRTERRFDVANPRLDLRLPGGHRLHAIMEVTDRPTVTIRCPHDKKTELTDIMAYGSLDQGLVDFLSAAVRARCNIIVAGGTGTGKTTLLRALLYQAPSHERIITIEDTIELSIGRYEENHPNVVEMETREANVEGVGGLSMMDLTRECLRMSPDRVVLGEVRGAEALYMLKAMSQGNDGSMCTLHSDSAYGVIDRIRGYVAEGTSGIPMEVIDGFFRNAVDLVVHIKVLPDRRRVLSSIIEVQKDFDSGVRYNELYAPQPNERGAAATPPSTYLMGRLMAADMRSNPWG